MLKISTKAAEGANDHPAVTFPAVEQSGDRSVEHKGNHYLILVDYYSNFIASLQHDTKSITVIKRIKANIARYGIMETLISDNGPQFVSSQPTVVHDKVMEYRRKQKLYHDRGSKSLHEFKPHDAVHWKISCIYCSLQSKNK